MRPRALRLAALLVATAACTFSPGRVVKTHQLLKPLPIGLVNAFNVEEQLARGFVPEALDFLESPGGRAMDSTRRSRVLGEALLCRGDFPGASVALERAFHEEGRISRRAEAAWLLSQAAWWNDDLAVSAHWARVASDEGQRIPEGWITFLASRGAARPYGGAPPGARLSEGFRFGRPDLIRVPVRFGGDASEELVVDSGASLSLLSESTVSRLGLATVPHAVAGAYGLHKVEIPMRFAWAERVEIGGVTLLDVPFGVLPDEALEFRTNAAGAFRVGGVLGAHLMKELDWRFDFAHHRLDAVRLDPAARRGSPGQNLFFRRLKPMVRASLNQEPWFLFLLDTGSEPTMVTRAGLRKSKFAAPEGAFPMTLEGIGNSRVSWGKLSNVTVGVDRYMVRFDDIVVKEEGEGIEDGVVGASFLSSFDVEIRFGAMTVRLDRPIDRLRREEGKDEPAEPFPIRRGRSGP